MCIYKYEEIEEKGREKEGREREREREREGERERPSPTCHDFSSSRTLLESGWPLIRSLASETASDL